MRLPRGGRRTSERVQKYKVGVGFSNTPNDALDLTEDENIGQNVQVNVPVVENVLLEVPVVENFQVNVPVVENVQVNLNIGNENEEDEESEQSHQHSDGENSVSESETEEARQIRINNLTHLIDQIHETSGKDFRTRNNRSKVVFKRKEMDKMKSNPKEKSIKISIKCSKNYASVRTRTSPNTFCSTIQSLTKEQKIALDEIGFGSFLNFKIHTIPAKLGFFVLDSFDEKKCRFSTRSGSVNVTSQSVHDTFGIPHGGIDLLTLKEVDEENPSYAIWWEQFNKSDKITITNIAKKIKDSDDSGRLFKLNFILLFVTTMCEAQKSGYGYLSVIQRLADDIDISTVDWCKYMLHCLVVTKKSWKKKDTGKYFNGPLTFLTLLYVDHFKSATIEVHREKPVLKSWTSDMLKDREADEVDHGGFGKYGMESNIVVAIQENDAVNVNQQKVKELRNKFARYVEYKRELDTLIKENLENQPENEEVLQVIKDYVELARNVPDFGSSSKDSSSKGKGKEQENPVTPNEHIPRIERLTGFISTHDLEVIDRDVETYKRQKLIHQDNNRDVENYKLQKVIDQIDDMPNFSLGVSQDNEVRDDPIIQKNEDAPIMENLPPDGPVPVDAHMPEAEPSNTENKEISHETLNVDELIKAGILLTPNDIEDDDVLVDRATMGKRVVKKSAQLCSPYYQKQIEVKNKVSRIEAKVSNRLFLLKGEPRDTIFLTKNSAFVFRIYMESLIPENWIATEVINCWTMVLNSEEPYIGNDSAFRLFLPIGFVTSSMLEGNYSQEVRIKYLANALGARLKLLKIKDFSTVKIVFFPMHRHGHYYLIVVDLKKGSFLIFDNVRRFSKPSEAYGEVPRKIHELFSGVLKLWEHPMANNIVFDDSKILDFKWQTSFNGNDCGVFVMRHMESFKGAALTRWNCGIGKESVEQKRQLIRLRRKYATKILLSDMNLKKDEVFKEAEIFDNETYETKIHLLTDAFARREERMTLL